MAALYGWTSLNFPVPKMQLWDVEAMELQENKAPKKNAIEHLKVTFHVCLNLKVKCAWLEWAESFKLIHLQWIEGHKDLFRE